MTTLQELNKRIDEIEESYRKLLHEEIRRRKELEELNEVMSQLQNEKSVLINEKNLLEMSEMTQEEKEYVDKQLHILEELLNHPSISEISIYVARPNSESETLKIRTNIDLCKEGFKYSVSIWSNRKFIMDRVHSAIHVPVYSEVVQDEEIASAYKNDYYWTKKEYPNVQMFKV